MTSPAPEKKPKKPGRPKKPPTQVVPLRLPLPLVEQIERFAAVHGLSRNQAAARLIEMGLFPISSGGYNPLTGDYDA